MHDELLDLDIFEDLRESKGLTKNYIQRKIGLGRNLASQMFSRGILPVTKTKRDDVLKRLADLFGVEVDYLILKNL